MAVHLYEYPSNTELVTALAEKICRLLKQAVSAKGSASMAVSGGNTPKPLFRAMSEQSVDWHKVFITLVDERWVDADHPDSNALLVKENLLINLAAAAQFFPLKTPQQDVFVAENEVAKQFDHFPMPLDVVILGMGNDGHTASFFPDAETLGRAIDPATKDRVCAVRPPTAAHDRMTLTLPVLESAAHCFLHIVGQEKLAVLEKARRPGRVEDMPIRTILQSQKLDTDIYYAPE